MPSSLSSIRSHWKHLLLPALVTALLVAWAIPAQMQSPTEPPQAYPICGSPRLEGIARTLNETVDRKPLSQEALRAEGKLGAQGELLADTVGNERQFWARDLSASTTTFYSLSATCMKVSDHAYLYLEDGRSLNDTVLANIINEFENNIYTKDRATFGSEWTPGIDGDAHVYLLLLDIKDGYTPGSGYVAGYFDPVNEFLNSQLPPEWPEWPHSNEKEMLYIDINPANPSSTDSYGTVAHEFQHMIHWNMSETATEETWVDEGCADLAQFICGYGHPASHLVTFTPSYPGFLEEPDHQLTLDGYDWRNEPHTLASYGAAYLWTLYLWEHYGGDATIKALVDEEDTGITGVNDVLAAKGYSQDFEDVFRDWVVANYLDDGTGAYGYQNIDLVASLPNYVTSFPRPAPAATHTIYPVTTQQGGVDYWAADAIRFAAPPDGNLRLTFDGADSDRFGVTVVRSTTTTFQPGTNTVSSMPLSAAWYGTTTVAGAEGVLLIPASLTPTGIGTSGYTYSASLDNVSYDHFTYLPLVLRAPAARPPVPGPSPGHWVTDEFTDFYVTPDGKYLRGFRTLVWFYDGTVDCGVQYATYPADVPIVDNQFSFVGTVYCEGTFTSQTSASITYYLDEYPMCGRLWYSPVWMAEAVWQDDSQPAIAAGEGDASPLAPAGVPPKRATPR